MNPGVLLRRGYGPAGQVHPAIHLTRGLRRRERMRDPRLMGRARLHRGQSTHEMPTGQQQHPLFFASVPTIYESKHFPPVNFDLMMARHPPILKNISWL